MRVKPIRFRVFDPVCERIVTATRFGKAWVTTCSWIEHCTGCCELGDYGSGSSNYLTHPKHGCLVGIGCDECGYHGIRRDSMWVPISKSAYGTLNQKLRKKLAV